MSPTPCREQLHQKPRQLLAQSPADTPSCPQPSSLPAQGSILHPLHHAGHSQAATAHDHEEKLPRLAPGAPVPSKVWLSRAKPPHLQDKLGSPAKESKPLLWTQDSEHSPGVAGASGVPRLFPAPHGPRCVLCVIKATRSSPALTPGGAQGSPATRRAWREPVGGQTRHTKESVTGDDVSRTGRTCYF